MTLVVQPQVSSGPEAREEEAEAEAETEATEEEASRRL
jgi:hypothetical protein